MKRIEDADHRGTWVRTGEPIAAKFFHMGDSPKGAQPSTLVLTFEYAGQGDYSHLIFSSPELGKWDFGYGANSLAGTPFEAWERGETEALDSKRFKVTWDFLEASFPCCDGQSDTYLGLKPSILSIEAAPPEHPQ